VVAKPECEPAATLRTAISLRAERCRLSDAAQTENADRGGDAHLPANVRVERHAAALSRPELIYPDSSTLPDLERSYAACPLQRKLDRSTLQPGARFASVPIGAKERPMTDG